MMRKTISFLAMATALGCGAHDDGGVAPLPAPTVIPAGIQTVLPASVFRGRPTTIAIGGAGTSFNAESKVTLGDGKVKVLGTTAISAVGLQASIYVPFELADATLDVHVDDLTAVSALALADPIELASPRGPVAQGSTVELTIVNHDLEHPFASGRLRLDAGPGVSLALDDVQPGSARVHAAVGPSAATGVRDLVVELDGDAATPLHAVIEQVMRIDARSITPITPDKPVDVVVADGQPGAYLSLKGGAGQVLDLRAVVATGEKGPVTPRLALFDAGKSTDVPLSMLLGAELLAVDDAAGDALLFVGPLAPGTAGATKFTVSAHLSAGIAASETEPNETSATANALRLPAIAAGALGSGEDVDVYALDVTTGTLLVRTALKPGETVGPDTRIEIVDASGKVLDANDDEDFGSFDTMSFVAVPVVTGRVYVRVRPGVNAEGYGISALGEYRLIGALR